MPRKTPTSTLAAHADPDVSVFRWTCTPGLEDVSADEARALMARLGQHHEAGDHRTSYETRPLGLDGHNALSTSLPEERVAETLMELRSAYHLIRHRGSETLSETSASASELAAALGQSEIPELADGTKSFRVSCTRSGEHVFRSPDVEREVGAVVVERYGSPVDLEEYDINLRVDVVGTTVLIGIQLSRDSLDRRYPWVYRPRVTLRTTVAYSMITLARRFAGESAADAALPCDAPPPRIHSLLDPFCGSGTIPIEASRLLGGTRIIAVDRDEEAVEGVRANAEAVGATDRIEIHSADARDLDQHYERGSVDAIVTNPPFGIRMHKEADFRRLYRRFLETAHVILAPGGMIVILIGKKRGVFNKILRELGLFDLLEVHVIEIGGVYPGVFVLRRRGTE